MHFALICQDKPGSLSIRMETRSKHLEWVDGHRNAGRIAFGGPFFDDEGNMNGSLLMLEVGDRAEAEALAADDPYAKAGLFQSVDIRPWKWVISPPEAGA